MAKALSYNATLVERIDLTSALAIFRVQPDEDLPGEGQAFVPGQYVTLGLNNEEKPELGSVRRPMSIASAPEQPQLLEFYIRWVAHPESDNPLTHLLWKAENGDRMFMRPKPVGHFTLPHTVGDDDQRLKVCVAAGTGLAPFLSMARSMLSQGAMSDLSQLVILHGASYPADLGYREELERLANDHGLRYRATVSRPKEAPDWRGDHGRVEDYFLPERLEDLELSLGLEHGGLTPSRAAVLICGLQGTIGATILRLLGRGFIPDNRRLRRALEVPEDAAAHLFFEQYDTSPVIDLDDQQLLEDLRRQVRESLDA